jgi:hypothetical protein
MENNIESYINYIAFEELNIEKENIDNEDIIKAKKNPIFTKIYRHS